MIVLTFIHKLRWGRDGKLTKTFHASDRRQLSKYVRVQSRDLLNLATHNYLGMVGDARVEAAGIAALKKYGVGACGPRTFFGTVGEACGRMCLDVGKFE